MAIYETLLLQNPGLAWLLIAGVLMGLQAAVGAGFLIPLVAAAAGTALLVGWGIGAGPLAQVLAFVLLSGVFSVAGWALSRRLGLQPARARKSAGRRGRQYVPRAEPLAPPAVSSKTEALTERRASLGAGVAAGGGSFFPQARPALPAEPVAAAPSTVHRAAPALADAQASALERPGTEQTPLCEGSAAEAASAPSGALSQDAAGAPAFFSEQPAPAAAPSDSATPSAGASRAPPAAAETGGDVRMIGRIARAKGLFHQGSGVVMIDGSERGAQVEAGQASPSADAPVRVLGLGPDGVLRVRSLRS